MSDFASYFLPYVVTPIVAALISSGGLWGYLQKKDQKRTATDRLLTGLAYGNISGLAEKYMSRGWITKDEYEDLHKYLYNPYRELGGNGTAERYMKEIEKLPLSNDQPEP